MSSTTNAAGAPAEEYRPNPLRWRALAVCLVAGFMTLLDVSIVNVALPSIRSGLSATQSDLQWILSGYALMFGLLLVPAGRFGDARGRRNAFVAGLALFTAASAAAGLAPTAGALVVARLVQGMAGGILNPQVSGLIQQLFRGEERGRAFGLLGATIGISTAVGPLLGGLLIQLGGPQEGWRWVFYVNLPVGIIAILLAFRLIPARPAAHRRRESLDPVGVLLLGLAVLAVLLPLVQDQQWRGSAKWLLIPVAVVLGAAFFVWERRFGRHAEPVIDLSLFRVRSYALGALIGLLYFAGFTAVFFTFTLYLQNGLHYSALLAGLAVTPFAVGSAVAAWLAGRFVVRLGRPLVLSGLIMVLVGLVSALIAVRLDPGDTVAWATAIPLLVAGVGSGMVISPNVTLTLSEVPVRRAGSAGGALQTGQRIGSAVGIAAVGSAFFGAVASSHGNWAKAYERGLVVVIAFVLAALIAAAFDVIGVRSRQSRVGHGARDRVGPGAGVGPGDGPPAARLRRSSVREPANGRKVEGVPRTGTEPDDRGRHR